VPKIRIVVVDDHVLFRSGLVSLLSDFPEFEVVGEADNGREALRIVHLQEPDVVLMDVNMPVMDGVEAVAALRKESNAAVLMLTVSSRDDDLFGAIAAGADGYLLKNTDPAMLRESILSVAAGKSILDPNVTGKVLKAVAAAGAVPPSNLGLSPREIDVLRQIARGKTTPAIAKALFISENTVKTHVRRIFAKLEVHTRVEAVNKAVELGIIRRS